ncbi:MAG: sugar phosphate nucleotidyltransferase [Gammaproteobacteria bacterium]
MKVVLFCGGLGTRLREHSETIPKPLVNIGYRPILWHLMRYYAHFGHKEFILCLGYRGDLVREYFLNYNEAMTNDFTLEAFHSGEKKVVVPVQDTSDWKITFVDTGLHSNIGQRLLRVKKYVENEPAFLANYADGLSDVPLDKMVEDFERKKAIATFASVRAGGSFHVVNADKEGMVTKIGAMPDQELNVNGGFFVLSREIFNYIQEGEELVEAPFTRLIAERRLSAYRWGGFWQCMDTLKDKISFDRMEARGQCPWMMWGQHPAKASR